MIADQQIIHNRLYSLNDQGTGLPAPRQTLNVLGHLPYAAGAYAGAEAAAYALVFVDHVFI